METFLASGVGWGGGGAFQEQQLIPLPSATQGRLNFTVPSFVVATFPTLCSPILSASIMVGASVPVPFSDSSLVANLPSGLLLQQPFIVGPSFSPILAKTDSQIVAGKYVDLWDLLSVNSVQTELPHHSPPRRANDIDDSFLRLLFFPSPIIRLVI